MSTSSSKRPLQSNPELDAREVAWWDQFATLENDFCWVQTPEIQQIIRREYVEEIIASSPPGGTVAELGCGTGWLCILLAKMGAKSVFGIDISAAQIELARRAAEQAGVSGSVTFQHKSAVDFKAGTDQYDVVVLHAFLHHLFQEEIRSVVDILHLITKPDGKVFVMEPFLKPGQSHLPFRARLLWQMLHVLELIPRRIRRFRPYS